MANGNNFQIANRAFQESFQRARALDLQRKREERFDRQLQINSQFQQSSLNLQRQRVDLERRRFESPSPLNLRTIQTGEKTSIFNPRTGQIQETAFPSAKVAGEGTGTALPGRFGVAARLKESGITGTALTEATENIPLDLNAEEAEGFLRGSDESALPFFKQSIIGFGKGFQATPFKKNVLKEDVEGPLKKFLQDTNFATSTPDQQTGILRAFESSLGIDIEGGDRAVPREEVEFDLKSAFFQKIVEAEKTKPIKVRNAKGEVGTVPANQLQDALEQGLILVE